MVRLKDIAAAAGVSVMTVSKVLRDAPDISAATKVRIRQLAQQMGYRPDSAAQGLRNRTTRLFGIIIPASTNPFIARTLMAIEEQAYEMGYDLIVAHSLNLSDREEHLIRRFLSRRIDGLFLSPVYRMEPAAPIYDELLRYRMPTVIMGHRAPFCSKFANVETDDIAGAYAATRHLLDLGHRKIAFLAGPRSFLLLRNGAKVFAALYAMPKSRSTTASSSTPAAPSKKAKQPPIKCSRNNPPSLPLSP